VWRERLGVDFVSSIERTAYPRLKRQPSSSELVGSWSLSPEEDLFVTSTAQGQQSLLALSLLVLMFRRLGRFVALHEVRPGVTVATAVNGQCCVLCSGQ
jgi:Domain of unknown function (DUF4158)